MLSFSWGIFGHITYLDQSSESKKDVMDYNAQLFHIKIIMKHTGNYVSSLAYYLFINWNHSRQEESCACMSEQSHRQLVSHSSIYILHKFITFVKSMRHRTITSGLKRCRSIEFNEWIIIRQVSSLKFSFLKLFKSYSWFRRHSFVEHNGQKFVISDSCCGMPVSEIQVFYITIFQR